MSPAPRAGGAPAPPDRRATALLRWFRVHRRPLPWRSSRDPYRVWVAEVLLQQTRVDQAVPYFERFVRRFPDVQALAAATEEQVLKVWQGAGYYARARRLRRAAREIVRRHRGRLPSSAGALERLPGIGPYTARAIAALAFGEPLVALEANGLRVTARWSREEGDVRSAAVRARLGGQLQALLPRGRAAEFNEAVMELGETVCLPVRPRCSACPVARSCRAARELEDPSVIPRSAPSRPRPHVRAAIVVLERRSRWLVQRRPSSGLLGGLWEFPGGKIQEGESPEEAARRELREEVGLDPRGPFVPAAVVRHGYSHFTVELHVFRAGSAGELRSSPTRRWATARQLERLALPRATEKVLERIGLPGGRTFAAAGRA